MKAKLFLPNKPIEDVELIRTIKANKRPNKDDILTFYGENAPSSAFNAIKTDRLVFRRKDGTHVIIPDIDRNLHLWSKS